MFKFGHLYSTLGSRAARMCEPEDDSGWAHTDEFVVCAAPRTEKAWQRVIAIDTSCFDLLA